ncbi:CBL-interacting serine/threonine-protein kinase 20 [Dermatophagoides pteronyssinus]|uniref:CBL-interacting serine/threonine-protein kinase 20 n=1 Tax=Dermatophagoides pteronyssinus TaxID=6956 RepID=A0ABQ8IUX5_DERPT|nr:CBL-interacting serine/threonine-protein kinase 20 [Dermatophagoides pteronyssinus]
MPFFNHSMAQSMRKSSNDPSLSKSKTKRIQIRSMPGSDKNQTVARSADPSISLKYTQKISQRKLLFTRSLLRSQIEQLSAQESALSVKQVPKLFDAFQIDTNNKLNDDPEVQMYPAKNTMMPEYVMMACIYTTKSVDPKNSFYLKVLRHLGRKHPYIVNTWEIFSDDVNVYIFQEFVPRGNIISYVEENPVNEKQLCFWARQIYRALDFLGDSGISHRNIKPNHLLLKPMGNELCVKLTGFKNSIIYWNIEENDVNFCQCQPISQQKNDGPNFQAPEVYGNVNEFFDPIIADIWSYGANLFFTLTQFYPYNIEYPHENLDEEVWHNISKIPNISNECQNFLFALMRSNANDRIPFDFIDKDDWFRKSYMIPN